ncbi:MAG: NAD(P)HX epimerase / NAD(P)HX dehydratase [uncultured Thiotrichaceae bacterium]|uniref:Bifunctional NAD(P)H-hydrate repair enzyme n=1 Tax=uncultured Thiotrichaceae bacterium TaxID=298394 RepID=A0A6S6SP91_9GAMM|nr:MAG: NAD(P)HX epimerase / NAD(P)HX dehydratase [uncultured Thiotrichaceae bacterium]
MPRSNRLYTAEQTRELDRLAIEEFGIPGYVLMKRAGQATFDLMREVYPATKSICIVCGMGNNGGDGYVIATLAVQAGLQVNLIQLGNAQSIRGDARIAREDYLASGSEVSAYAERLLDVDIIVDAIFGTGLTRKVEGDWAAAIDGINRSKAQVVAVDIPSGLNADTGRVLGTAVKADLTVTYIGVKCGLVTGQARDFVGDLKFDDLNVSDEVYQQLHEASTDTTPKGIIPDNLSKQLLKRRARCGHKGSHGHALLIGGTQGMSGAIRLAGEACLRTGAGLVSVATHPAHADYVNITRPELMVSGIQQAEDLLPLLEKASVIAIGPGLGKTAWSQELLTVVLESDKPMVLDADALNLLSTLSISKQNWILTPHPAEAARLLATETAEIENDRYQSVEKLCKKWGGVCVLKGAGSLVSDGQQTAVCTAGNPGMASGGMGDVLTGVIASLLAQGLSLYDAAMLATQLHAQAADLATEKGERGMLASDLFTHLRVLANV